MIAHSGSLPAGAARHAGGMQRLDTDVLVVGSGLTGATAALLLAPCGPFRH
jgi:monoamine oxidase